MASNSDGEESKVIVVIPTKEVILKNGSRLVLKSPKAEDAQIMLTYLKELFHQSYQNMARPKDFWDHFPLQTETKILSDFLCDPSKFMIAAFREDKIIGNISCISVDKDFAKFNARIGMGIEKSFHNIGLGTALLNYAIDCAKKNGVHRLELTVRTFNDAGIALYEKVGFRKVGILKEAAFIDDQFHDEYLYEMLIG